MRRRPLHKQHIFYSRLMHSFYAYSIMPASSGGANIDCHVSRIFGAHYFSTFLSSRLLRAVSGTGLINVK